MYALDRRMSVATERLVVLVWRGRRVEDWQARMSVGSGTGQSVQQLVEPRTLRYSHRTEPTLGYAGLTKLNFVCPLIKEIFWKANNIIADFICGVRFPPSLEKKSGGGASPLFFPLPRTTPLRLRESFEYCTDANSHTF